MLPPERSVTYAHALQAIQEGKRGVDTARTVDREMAKWSEDRPPDKEEGEEDGRGSIFLIDLETVDDAQGGRKLKPQPKKFSASNLFQSKLPQNWFFK